MSSVVIEEITDDDQVVDSTQNNSPKDEVEKTTTERDETTTQEMIEKLKNLIVNNPSMTKYKEEKKAADRELLRKKLRARIRHEQGKRQRDMPENTEYDSKGKKIGRQKKEFIKLDPSDDPNDPQTINKFLSIMRAAAANPDQKSSLLKVLNLSEEKFDSILEQTKEVDLGRTIQLEQIIA